MKIALIQPKHLRVRDRFIEPLGLGYLASFLKTKGYKDIKIYNIFVSDRKIIKEASAADVVGITATSPLMIHANILTRAIKKKNPKVVIVLGGAHPSALPEATLSNENIDFVVRGEGEITFYELISALERKKEVNGIPGLSYRRDGRIYHAKTRELVTNIDILPHPARDLFGQEVYTRRYYKELGTRSASIFSSRGCPFECINCASHCIWTRKWRARSPENIVEEIKGLITKYNIEKIYFEDDTFTVSKARVIHFCDLLNKEKVRIAWGCYVHVNTVDREILQIMKNAGCVDIWVGVESGSPKILQELKKGTNIEKIKTVFKTAREIKLNTLAFLMIGAPSEDFCTINETVVLINEIKPHSAGLYILTPMPGSEFYQIVKEKGYINDHADWSRMNWDRATVCTNNLSKKELNKEYKRLCKIFINLRQKIRFNFHYLFFQGLLKLKNVSSFSEFIFLFFQLWRYLKSSVFYKRR